MSFGKLNLNIYKLNIAFIFKSAILRVNSYLYSILNESATLLIQDPITIPKFSEPEPDITIAKFDPNFYAEKNPLPKDIIILIEVSDSTLAKDREVKLPIYANAKIKEYWIVNLVDNCIEVYNNPTKDIYKLKETFYLEDEISLTDFNLKIKVSSILVK